MYTESRVGLKINIIFEGIFSENKLTNDSGMDLRHLYLFWMVFDSVVEYFS